MGGAAGAAAHEPDIPSAEPVVTLDDLDHMTLGEQIEVTRQSQEQSLRAVQALRRGQQDIIRAIMELRAEDGHRRTGHAGAQGDPGLVVRRAGTMDAPSSPTSPTGSDVLRHVPPQGPPQGHAFKQNNAKWLRQTLKGSGVDKSLTKSMSGEGRPSQRSADGSGGEGREGSRRSEENPMEDEPATDVFEELPQTSCRTRARRCAAAVVHSRMFDTLVALVILANSLTIGVEIQWGVDGRDKEDMRFLDRLEHGFIAFYTVEICVRLIASVEDCVKSRWFWMDVVLVSTGIITQWILGLLLGLGDSEDMDLIGQVLIIRILRLLRLVRALRTITFFQDLWKLVNGVLGSLRTVLSALFLLVAFTFIFACLSVYVIMKNDRLLDNPETAEIVRERFSNIPMSMLTLLQFAFADSISEIYGPLIVTDNWLLAYFGLVFILFTIALMNLVTAVIVEHAIECSKYDREMEQVMMRKRLGKVQPQILQVFRQMDQSGNGKISIGELKDWQVSKQGLPHDIRDLVMPDALADLFEFLDTDNSGEIDEGEFVDGISHLALSNKSIESTQILQLLRDSRRCLQSVVVSMGGDSAPAGSPTRLSRSRSISGGTRSHACSGSQSI